MRRLARCLLIAAILGAGCINFDGKLAECDAGRGVCARDDASVDAGDDGSVDAGNDGGSDAGAIDGGDIDAGGMDGGTDAGTDAGSIDAGTFGFCFNGFCWLHPRPFGEDLEAVTGTSAQDLWVAGRAGLVAHWDGSTWRDYRVPGVLKNEDSQAGDLRALIIDPTGALVVGGNQVLPRHLDGGGAWSTDSYLPLPPSRREIRQFRLDGGQLIAVGATSDSTAIRATWGSSRWTETTIANGFGHTVNFEGPEPVYGVGGSADVKLMRADAGVLATFPGVSGGQIYASWREPDGVLRVAGYAFLGSLESDGGTTRSTLGFVARSGLWVPGRGVTVMTGTSQSIYEGTDGNYLGQTPLDNLLHPSLDYLDVWFDPPGDAGFIVGSAGILLSWDGTSWVAANDTYGRTRHNYNAYWVTRATPDLVFVGGDDGLKGLVSDGDIALLSTLDSSVHRVVGAWIDDAGVITAEANDQGGLSRVCQPSSLALDCDELAVSDAGFTSMWGDSRSNLYIATTNGKVLHFDGSSSLTTVATKDAGLTAIAFDGRDVLVGAGNGWIYAVADGGLRSVAQTGNAVVAMTQLPTGDVFGVGSNTTFTVHRADAGWASTSYTGAPAYRPTTLNAVFAFTPNDVWAVGDDGVALNWNGTTATFVETGTRRRLLSISGRQTGGTHELWIGGEFGAILYKRY